MKGTERTARASVRMLWRQMEGQRLRYGAALLALLPSAALLYLAPMVPQAVIDQVLVAEPRAGTSFSRGIVALLGGPEQLRERLWLAGVAILALTAAAGVFTFLRGRWAAQASERIVRRLRERIYDHLQRLPIAWHHQANTGDLVQRSTSDVETVRQFFATQVVEIGRAVAMFIVPLPWMLAMDPRMTLASVVLMPVIVSFSYFFYRRVRQNFLKVEEAEGAMTGVLQQNLVGIRVVRAFARQEHEEKRYGERIRAHRDLDRRLFRILATFWSSSDGLCLLQLVILVGYGSSRLLAGSLAPGEFYWFIASVNLFLWPMRFMGRILTELGKATVAIGRIAEILEVPEESQPEPAARAAAEAEEARRAAAAGSGTRRGEIAFDRVRYAPSHGEAVLDGLDFRIGAGETIALLGPSGSGKSTIARLLLRFIDPTGGAIRLDGRDIATIPRQAMRERIAVVLQEPFLYSKTVRENIWIGRRSASVDEIEGAARTACIHEGIVGFTDGYETMVGERGITLSGGQRQRVALARALLDRPDILILDDALSAVDTDTEGWILSGLAARRGEHTTILIAHRLSTLIHADRILVLEGGRVAEQGTHEELARRPGLYQRLWRLESALEEESLLGAAVSEVAEVAGDVAAARQARDGETVLNEEGRPR